VPSARLFASKRLTKQDVNDQSSGFIPRYWPVRYKAAAQLP
jgi:hypothetical protein